MQVVQGMFQTIPLGKEAKKHLSMHKVLLLEYTGILKII